MLVLVCNQRLQRGFFFCVLIPSEHLLSLRKVQWKKGASWEKHGEIKQVPTASVSYQGNCRNTDLSDLQ